MRTRRASLDTHTHIFHNSLNVWSKGNSDKLKWRSTATTISCTLGQQEQYGCGMHFCLRKCLYKKRLELVH